MRILHVTTFLQGGAGRIIAALAIAQRRQGHDVTVVADDGGADGYGSYPEYLAALTAAGVPVVAVRSTFTRDYVLCAFDQCATLGDRVGATADGDIVTVRPCGSESAPSAGRQQVGR